MCACSAPEFEATKYPVTNREFLAFVEDGGYKKTGLWTEEGEGGGGGLKEKTALVAEKILSMFYIYRSCSHRICDCKVTIIIM